MKKFSLFLSAILFSVMSFAQTVPTNEELWEAFKPYYNTYYGLDRADQPIENVASFAATLMQDILTNEASEYKWLGDYIVEVATAQGYELASEANWRWHADSFFNKRQRTSWPATADFTQAGEPKAWGPAYLAAQGTDEPVIEWIPMELEISNLTTMEMPVGDVTYLQLMGRNDMMDADVMLFLNNYTGEDKAYEVNAESSLVTFGGLELTVLDGSITKTTDEELGDVFAGTVHAFVEEDGEGLYVEFALNMYAAPATEIEIEDVTITIDEESAIATFAAEWEGTPLSVEVSGFEAAEFMEYDECWLSIGDDNVWVDAAVGPVAIIIADGVAELEGEFTSYATGKSYYVMLSGTLPVKEEPVEMVGVVKRALQNGNATIVLTHEADGTAHIYNVVNGVAAEVSQNGVIAVDPENAGDFLAISDIALTEDGKLVATNKIVCQASDNEVDAGYKRGELRAYIWNDLHDVPSLWFTSKMSSNWYRSVQGQTIAYKGTSTNGTLFTTGVTATGVKFRYSVYNVIDGVYTDPAVNDSEHFHFTKGSAQTTDVLGANYQLVASPLAATNWILDGELVDPFEIVDPLTYNTEVTANPALAIDLGKKYNGTSIVTVGEQVLMVAPYATAEGLLAGVKVLDITAGLDAATEVAVADLDAAVEATAAATAVAVNENVLTITLVADATLHTLVVELAPATSGTTLTATGLETKLESDGSYTLQGQAVVNGDESNLMDFMLCVYPTEGYTDAFLNNWAVMIFGAPTPGAFVDNGDGTFTYTAKIEDTYGDGTVYNINMSGTIKTSDGPDYMELDDQITNLTFDLENMVMTGGPSTNYEIEVVLGLGEDNFDGTFTLSSESTVSVRGVAAEFIEGYAYNIDPYAPSAVAVVKVNWDGMYYAFTLNMSAGVAEATVIEINDATVTIDTVPLFDDVVDYALKMTANWTNPEDGLTYPVLVEVPVYYPEAAEPYSIMSNVTVGDLVDENGPWLGFGEGDLTVTTEGGVVTAKGVVSSWDGTVIDITISGKLPQGPATGLGNVQVEVNTVKVIKNGMLIINRDGVEYNVQGTVVK